MNRQSQCDAALDEAEGIELEGLDGEALSAALAKKRLLLERALEQASPDPTMARVMMELASLDGEKDCAGALRRADAALELLQRSTERAPLLDLSLRSLRGALLAELGQREVAAHATTEAVKGLEQYLRAEQVTLGHRAERNLDARALLENNQANLAVVLGRQRSSRWFAKVGAAAFALLVAAALLPGLLRWVAGALAALALAVLLAGAVRYFGPAR